MRSMWQMFKKIVDYIENIEISIYHFLSFLFIVLLRIFFESFSDTDAIINFLVHIHYILFYSALILFFILLIRAITGNALNKIINIILYSFSLILLPPLVDLIVSRGKGLNMDYLLPAPHNDLIYRYFHFSGDFLRMGVTPGLKVEVAIFLLLIFLYFVLKTKSMLKSIIGLFFAYNIFFFFAVTPFILFPYSKFYNCFSEINNIFINYYSLLVIFLSVVLFYVFKKEIFRALIGDFRFLRQAHYILMYFFGITIGTMMAGIENILIVVRPDVIVIYILSIVFGLLFSGIANNVIDYNIDKISNTDRPLVQGKIDLDFYKKLALIFFALSLYFASLNGYKSLFYEALFIGNYFLYSMPPLRLKRVFFFSKLLVSLNSLILVFMGYSYFFPDLKLFPGWIIFIFLTGFTASIQFIDIKDYEGDKKEGIKTLPVVFGLKNAKIIIGLSFLINYLLFNFIIKNNYFLAASVLAGLWQFYLINKKEYKEKAVFISYLLSWIVFMCLFIYFY